MYTTLENIKYFGKLTALTSFVYGSIIFIGFLLLKDSSLDDVVIGIGLSFVGIALIINSLMFLILIAAAIYYKNNSFELFGTCGLLLVNIPVAILYFLIVIENL